MPADAAPAFLYLPDLDPGPGTIVLPPDEAHYVARVCRARAGDRVTATDGNGLRATLELDRVEPTAAARVIAIEHTPRGDPAWLLCGAPDAGRADWMVEKLAELGVARFQPIDCARRAWQGVRVARWERLAIAALRQSQRTWKMTVAEPLALDRVLADLPDSGTRWLAAADGAPWRRVPVETPSPDAAAAPPPPEFEHSGVSVAAVGPGPGFSPAEFAALEAARFQPVRLADGRLRTETAAIAWACAWAAAGL